MAILVHDQYSFGILILSLASAEESTAFKFPLVFSEDKPDFLKWTTFPYLSYNLL